MENACRKPMFLLPLTLSQICLCHLLPWLPRLGHENCPENVTELQWESIPSTGLPPAFSKTWVTCLPWGELASMPTAFLSFLDHFSPQLSTGICLLFCWENGRRSSRSHSISYQSGCLVTWFYHPHTRFIPSVPVYLCSRSSPFSLPLAVASIIPCLPRISRLSFSTRSFPLGFKCHSEVSSGLRGLSLLGLPWASVFLLLFPCQACCSRWYLNPHFSFSVSCLTHQIQLLCSR